MSEWMRCDACGLRFRQRADGNCPRCAKAPSATPAAAPEGDVFDEAVWARRRAEIERTERETSVDRVSAAVRVAGGIMAANGMLQLAVGALESSAQGAAALFGPWMATFDLVVGAILLSGQLQVRGWATTRATLGGLGLAAIHALAGHRSTALMGVLFGIGLLLLLVSRAGKPRLVFGVATAGAAAVMAALAAAPFMGVRNPIGVFSAGLNGDIDWVSASSIEGREVRYRATLPGKGWHVVREEPEAERDDDEADEEPGRPRIVQEVSPAVRQPDKNVDVQIAAFQFPSHVQLDSEKAIDSLVDEARDNLPELMVAEEETLHATGGTLRVLEGTAWVDGRRTAVALGFGVHGQCVVLVSSTAPPRMYPAVRGDLMQVFESVETSGC